MVAFPTRQWRAKYATAVTNSIKISASFCHLARSPVPQMPFLSGRESQLSVRDSTRTIEACKDALDIAIENPVYVFGTTPSWLREPHLTLGCLSLAAIEK